MPDSGPRAHNSLSWWPLIQTLSGKSCIYHCIWTDIKKLTFFGSQKLVPDNMLAIIRYNPLNHEWFDRTHVPKLWSSKCLSLYCDLWHVRVSSHPKMPRPAKVSTNHFLDVMTVKCRSSFKGNSQIPLMLTDSFVHIFPPLGQALQLQYSRGSPGTVSFSENSRPW